MASNHRVTFYCYVGSEVTETVDMSEEVPGYEDMTEEERSDACNDWYQAFLDSGVIEGGWYPAEGDE